MDLTYSMIDGRETSSGGCKFEGEHLFVDVLPVLWHERIMGYALVQTHKVV